MNADHFRKLLSNPAELYKIGYQEIKSLVLEYPYCQNLRDILVKKSQIENHNDYERNLNMAATYSIDRTFFFKKIKDFKYAIPSETVKMKSGFLEIEPLDKEETLPSEIPKKVNAESVSDLNYQITEPAETSNDNEHLTIVNPDLKEETIAMEDKPVDEPIMPSAKEVLPEEINAENKEQETSIYDVLEPTAKEIDTNDEVDVIIHQPEQPIVIPIQPAKDNIEPSIPVEEIPHDPEPIIESEKELVQEENISNDILSILMKLDKDEDKKITDIIEPIQNDESKIEVELPINDSQKITTTPTPPNSPIERRVIRVIRREITPVDKPTENNVEETQSETTSTDDDPLINALPLNQEVNQDLNLTENEPSQDVLALFENLEPSETIKPIITTNVEEDKEELKEEEKAPFINNDTISIAENKVPLVPRQDSIEEIDIEAREPDLLSGDSFSQWLQKFRSPQPMERDDIDTNIHSITTNQETTVSKKKKNKDKKDKKNKSKKGNKNKLKKQEEIKEEDALEMSIDIEPGDEPIIRKKKKKKAVNEVEPKKKKKKKMMKEVNELEPKKKKKKKKKKKNKIKLIAMRSLLQSEEIASETLAELLVSQGKYDQAIELYERLSVMFPNKKEFFEEKITQIRNL